VSQRACYDLAARLLFVVTVPLIMAKVTLAAFDCNKRVPISFFFASHPAIQAGGDRAAVRIERADNLFELKQNDRDGTLRAIVSYPGGGSEQSASARFASSERPGERFNVRARCSSPLHSSHCLSWWYTSPR
jgi:hypothetical protein